jgi:predicted GIY-YIG superfamily endonuclease
MKLEYIVKCKYYGESKTYNKTFYSNKEYFSFKEWIKHKKGYTNVQFLKKQDTIIKEKITPLEIRIQNKTKKDNITKFLLDTKKAVVFYKFVYCLIKDKEIVYVGKTINIQSRIQQHKIDNAIKSRSFVQDINMSTDQVFIRMEQLLHKIEPSISNESKVMALDIMKDLYSKYNNVEVNIRSLIKASRICQMKFDNPIEMIAEQIISSK